MEQIQQNKSGFCAEQIYFQELRKHIRIDTYGGCSNMPCEQPCYENLARGVAKLFSTKVIHFSKKLKLNYWILEKKAQRNIIKLINYLNCVIHDDEPVS